MELSSSVSHATRRDEYLRARADEKEQRKRDALRRIAPGFEPQGHLLVPTKRSSVIVSPPAVSPPPKSVMEDLNGCCIQLLEAFPLMFVPFVPSSPGFRLSGGRNWREDAAADSAPRR
ncbi:hypothetical protein C8R47DRAFT_1212371 [Mycena vitilis]|nr:hypothetical protein C8R47DRAFT_1212371 [Mycena vitilis]